MTESHGRTDGEKGPTTTQRPARWPEDGELIRRLFAEYREWVRDHGDTAPSSRERVVKGLALIDGLIADLPRPYRPPLGDILLWFDKEGLVACGALRQLEPGVGEIRRLQVRADHRGGEFGRPFVRALIARARTLGFETVRADTLSTMRGAIEFYTELGFHPVPAFWPHPAEGALFFERPVDEETRGRVASTLHKSD